jgi:hypothetical protein
LIAAASGSPSGERKEKKSGSNPPHTLDRDTVSRWAHILEAGQKTRVVYIKGKLGSFYLIQSLYPHLSHPPLLHTTSPIPLYHKTSMSNVTEVEQKEQKIEPGWVGNLDDKQHNALVQMWESYFDICDRARGELYPLLTKRKEQLV